MADSMFSSVLDRDLICQSRPMSMGLGMPGGFGMGMCNPYMNTSFLGGITMAPALTSDVYGCAKRGKFKNYKDITTALLGMTAFFGTLFIGSKFSKLFKAIGKKIGRTK